MKNTRIALLAGAALTLAWSGSAEAQTVDRSGWWAPMVLEAAQQATQDGGSWFPGRVRTGGNEDVRRAPTGSSGRVEASGERGRKGNGPPFCRNGQGHPVHGWQWCVDKGWAGNSAWARESWTDVIFGGGRRPARDTRISEPTLGGILGDIVFGRLSRAGREAGLSGALDGRWVPLASGGSVLQLRMGGVPLAELADLNRDGRAEVVLLNRSR